VPPPDADLVRLYCDLAMLAGDAGAPPADSLRAAVFTRHGTTQAAYEAALQPWRDDPRGWVRFFQAVLDTLQERTGTRPRVTGFTRDDPPAPGRPQPPGG
jgi:hypothetical protein